MLKHHLRTVVLVFIGLMVGLILFVNEPRQFRRGHEPIWNRGVLLAGRQRWLPAG